MENRRSNDPVLRTLANWLGPKVTISVSPTRFTFRADDRVIELPTFVAVESSGQILGVGEDVPAASRVDLFTSSSEPVAGVDKLQCLVELCRFGLMKLFGRGPLVRPAVTVVGADTLAEKLQGYQQPLLREALIDAGGRDIQFQDREAA
jgi:hypothetical protein